MSIRMVAPAFIVVLMGIGIARATDIYQVDPVVAQYTRTVEAHLAQTGGTIEVPASDGVTARLSYPSNDACPAQKVSINALGPAGVARDRGMETFDAGWKPFYKVRLIFSGCAAQYITFRGLPTFTVLNQRASPNGARTYAMRIEFGSGHSMTRIEFGPQDEYDNTRVRFSLQAVPWARSNGLTSVPLIGYDIVVAMQ